MRPFEGGFSRTTRDARVNGRSNSAAMNMCKHAQVAGLHVAPPLEVARVGEAEVQVRWSAAVLPRAVIQGRWRLSIKVRTELAPAEDAEQVLGDIFLVAAHSGQIVHCLHLERSILIAVTPQVCLCVTCARRGVCIPSACAYPPDMNGHSTHPQHPHASTVSLRTAQRRAARLSQSRVGFVLYFCTTQARSDPSEPDIHMLTSFAQAPSPPTPPASQEAAARHKFLRLAPNRAYDLAITGVPDDGGASWTSSFVDFRLGSIVLDMTAGGARSPRPVDAIRVVACCQCAQTPHHPHPPRQRTMST